MKAAFFDLENWEIDIINEKNNNNALELIKLSGELLNKNDFTQIKEVEILSVSFSRVDQETIDSLPNLKLISTRTAGFDNIDVQYAKQKNITVINVPSYGEDTVAEYAMSLILSLTRKLNMTFVRSMFGVFEHKDIRGIDLCGKTLGVIGTGKIGRKLIKMANGFDVNILCYDLYPNQEVTEKYTAKYVDLEELLKNSDVISIHCPYSKETHHLINPDTIKLLKKGVLLVNTSRGQIVDTSAVLQGMKDGIFGGVALDTFEGEEVWLNKENLWQKGKEPTTETFKRCLEAFFLLKFRNVILTPHNAFNSQEAVTRIITTTIDGVLAFNSGNDVLNKIT